MLIITHTMGEQLAGHPQIEVAPDMAATASPAAVQPATSSTDRTGLSMHHLVHP
ncbi:MAG: hypothetical protein HRU70_06990 [Phycisphaeraceae bacterium]|nr:MAG: hypothetical protein HRU70_06990 [Phycisphaeraceae bacterium]